MDADRAVDRTEELLSVERAPICNAMSVDVEEYFQVSAFENHVDRDRWPSIPGRVEANVERILALFDEYRVTATFFTLGWIAERYPGMVQKIANAGHEIASHGMSHVRATQLERTQFYADVHRSRALLEDITGQRVHGYRAPSYSVNRSNLWAHDMLDAAGFTYSSSIYPGKRSAYGMPGAPRFAFKTAGNAILEIPVTTAEIAGRRLPCAGGGFFRLYPYAITRTALMRINRHEARSAVFYFHPWEIDPGQPRIPNLDMKTRIRHYLNLRRVEPRLHRLLADFRWDRIDRVFAAEF